MKNTYKYILFENLHAPISLQGTHYLPKHSVHTSQVISRSPITTIFLCCLGHKENKSALVVQNIMESMALVYFASMVPFDKIKPLIAKRMVSVNDPRVKATFNSLPTPAINRNNAEAIWFTSKRTRHCLKNLHYVDTKCMSLFICRVQVKNESRKDQRACLLSMCINKAPFTFQYLDQIQ